MNQVHIRKGGSYPRPRIALVQPLCGSEVELSESIRRKPPYLQRDLDLAYVIERLLVHRERILRLNNQCIVDQVPQVSKGEWLAGSLPDGD
jgi:hypothetical protein